jgi:asparagine synthase (glutamine-hydrolysing)
MRSGREPIAELLADLPAQFASWTPLAQDQYLEKRTLLAGYLLSSQGDRMLMAHSIEGRFPFLDSNVAALADSLPDSYKLRALDEKHVLKRAAADLVPAEILARKKQPYRAPDAAALIDATYIDDLLCAPALRDAGVFEPQPVMQLLRKCRERIGLWRDSRSPVQFSNADNMALVGIVSTQFLHQQLIAGQPALRTNLSLRTDVDLTLLKEAA